MKRADLESKVRISVGPASAGGRTEMTATLEVRAAACLDPYVVSAAPELELVSRVERLLRESVVREVRADLETENQRLRAALEKWGRRALNRRHWKDAEDEEAELKGDLVCSGS